MRHVLVLAMCMTTVVHAETPAGQTLDDHVQLGLVPFGTMGYAAWWGPGPNDVAGIALPAVGFDLAVRLANTRHFRVWLFADLTFGIFPPPAASDPRSTFLPRPGIGVRLTFDRQPRRLVPFVELGLAGLYERAAADDYAIGASVGGGFHYHPGRPGLGRVGLGLQAKTFFGAYITPTDGTWGAIGGELVTSLRIRI